MAMDRATTSLARLIEEALGRQQVPASRIINQLAGSQVAPATGTTRGSVALSDATPETLGTATAGSDSTASRGDHVHAHGDLAGGSLHAIVTSGSAGFLPAWEEAVWGAVPHISFSGGIEWSAIGGTGTVTSVALTAPAELTVTGSPITDAGTLALAWATQAANRILAGPTTGADAAPTFRALVAADIPDLDTAKLTTGQLSPARGGTGVDNATRTLTIATNGGTLAFSSASSTLTIPATGTAALLATANVFTANQRIDANLGISAAPNANYSITALNTVAGTASSVYRAFSATVADTPAASNQHFVQALIGLADSYPGSGITQSGYNRALQGTAANRGIGTLAENTGIYGSSVNVTTGTVTAAYGIYAQAIEQSTGRNTTAYGIYIATVEGLTAYSIYNAATSAPLYHGPNYIELSEMTAPAAPPANGVRLFARDNGSGKTELCAIFATGAVQQVAIQP